MMPYEETGAFTDFCMQSPIMLAEMVRVYNNISLFPIEVLDEEWRWLGVTASEGEVGISKGLWGLRKR